MWPYTIQNIFLYSIKKYLFLMTLIIKKERRKNQSKQQQKQTETYRLNTSNKHLTNI